MRIVYTLITFITAFQAYSQTKITWDDLKDVRFTDEYSKEVDANYYYPHFGASVKAMEGKELIIKGYMLVINRKLEAFVLSRNPYAQCFFCGNGGPESIIELTMKPDYPFFKMDDMVTIKGRLVLNQDNIYRCNYILEDAVVYEE